MVKDVNFVHNQFVSDLHTITKLNNQWKMKFNPDITKQATEIIFSSKYKKETHPPLVFNDIPMASESYTKLIVESYTGNYHKIKMVLPS